MQPGYGTARIRITGIIERESTSCVHHSTDPADMILKPFLFIACHVTYAVKPDGNKIVSNRLGQSMIYTTRIL